MRKKILIIICLMVVLTFFSGITYSMLKTGTNLGTTDQGIAKFIFNAQKLNAIGLSLDDIKPGDNKEYLFSVSNSDDNTSEVSIEYEIIIKTYHLIPVTIELYKVVNNIDTLIGKCDETYTRNSENEIICNIPKQIMNYSTSINDNYKLKVSYPTNDSDEYYSNLVDYIDIEIKSWQKVGE